MSMALMVAMANRKRDERGRYSEGDEMRRMGNDHSTYMGDQPEMRRRRDSNGRYMEGGDDARMEYGAESAYRPWREPHIPPYSRRMEDSPRMRDRNVVNIRDYQDRRQIGFATRMDDDEEGAEMRQYGRRFDPDRAQMHHGAMRESEQHMGRAEASDEHLTREEAEEWVRGMQSADGKKGGRWTLQEIQQYAGNYGISGDEVTDFFAVLNALHTDYGKVARKYGVDKMEFWADLAKAFIRDPDAMPGKVKLYYECIAKKDD